jgi:MerR family transcriptional regulator, heat shock protein HspR
VALPLTGVRDDRRRSGLLEPLRTEGGTRPHSRYDIQRAHHITALLDAGLDLAGIAFVLGLRVGTLPLRREIGWLCRRRGPA